MFIIATSPTPREAIQPSLHSSHGNKIGGVSGEKGWALELKSIGDAIHVVYDVVSDVVEVYEFTGRGLVMG